MPAESHALLIWGAGGHGRVVADVARAARARVVGFLDRDVGKVGMSIDTAGAKVVVDEAELIAVLSGRRALPFGATAIALGIGDNRTRSECRARLRGVPLPPLVHPSAILSPAAVVRDGAVVMPRVVVNTCAVVEEGAILNTAAVVEHDCVVGEDAHISPGAVLAGGVRVARGAWVGAGATIIPKVHIGEWAVVGAGAVVTRDVGDATTVVGNPARLLRRRP